MAFSSPILKSPLIKVNRRKISSSSFRPINNTASISSTLEETNKILVEIQQQIGIAFEMRNAEEKEKNENLKEERSRRRLRLREGALESVKKIGGAIKKTAEFVASPFKGFFEKVLEFISLLGTGIAANAAFGWFRDPENQKKILKFFNILKENWKTIALIAGALAVGALIAKIAVIVGGLKGFTAFLLNPATLAALTLLAATVSAMTGKSQSEMIAGILGDGDDTQRKKLIKGLVQLREMDDDQLKNSKITNDPIGFRRELSESIYFLKTGEQIRYGFNFLKGPKEYADEAKFVEGLDFGDFKDVGARLQGIFDTTGGAPTVKKREMGGPVMSGNTYLVGEKGPELFAPNIDGSIVNNMRTEKIYEMISSKNAGKINFVSMELPPKFMNSGKNTSTEEQQEIPIPTISAVNGSNPYMSITPNVYGIYV